MGSYCGRSVKYKKEQLNEKLLFNFLLLLITSNLFFLYFHLCHQNNLTNLWLIIPYRMTFLDAYNIISINNSLTKLYKLCHNHLSLKCSIISFIVALCQFLPLVYNARFTFSSLNIISIHLCQSLMLLTNHCI